jgi:hypothetical protein
MLDYRKTLSEGLVSNGGKFSRVHRDTARMRERRAEGRYPRLPLMVCPVPDAEMDYKQGVFCLWNTRNLEMFSFERTAPAKGALRPSEGIKVPQGCRTRNSKSC